MAKLSPSPMSEGRIPFCEGMTKGKADVESLPSTGGLEMPSSSEVDVLTAQDVALLLRCNLKTVYESARAGTIPCIRLGRSFRFSRQAILSSLGTCKSASRRKEH
jgi:excisionase family DNA binding protein